MTAVSKERLKRKVAPAVWGYGLVKDGIDGPYFPTLTLDGHQVRGIVYATREEAQRVATAIGAGLRVQRVALRHRYQAH